MPSLRRKLTESKLVVASHNEGKVKEIKALMSPFGIETVSARELLLPEPEETGNTFIANAELKALAAARAANLPALSDDSGLCVDALDGAPGIYSARWAGPDKDFALAMEKVQKGLEEAQAQDPDVGHGAHFTCALTLAWPDGHAESFEGRVHGALVWPPRGEKGFGYDPVFKADGEKLTFGEMAPDKKHAMSHRADAFRQLIAACLN
ncbi:MAG: RdgB/HAM1 family non-canonical purine NTP pyrophosphatase [Pseudomonadota bacterium]